VLDAHLFPAVLTQRGLAAALQALATRSGVPVHLLQLPRRRFPAVVEATAYFVAAEALDNAVEHSGAGRIGLRAADDGERLLLEVRDDGAGGADPAGASLRALADRAAMLGGTLSVESPPDGGTLVQLALPVEQ
jgi:signal transduction histidine kinase